MSTSAQQRDVIVISDDDDVDDVDDVDDCEDNDVEIIDDVDTPARNRDDAKNDASASASHFVDWPLQDRVKSLSLSRVQTFERFQMHVTQPPWTPNVCNRAMGTAVQRGLSFLPGMSAETRRSFFAPKKI
jgi:hypothetical protein